MWSRIWRRELYYRITIQEPSSCHSLETSFVFNRNGPNETIGSRELIVNVVVQRDSKQKSQKEDERDMPGHSDQGMPGVLHIDTTTHTIHGIYFNREYVGQNK